MHLCIYIVNLQVLCCKRQVELSVICSPWLHSYLIPMYIQKRLFHFLNYSFKHSPLDANFRYVSALLLTLSTAQLNFSSGLDS